MHVPSAIEPCPLTHTGIFYVYVSAVCLQFEIRILFCFVSSFILSRLTFYTRTVRFDFERHFMSPTWFHASVTRPSVRWFRLWPGSWQPTSATRRCTSSPHTTPSLFLPYTSRPTFSVSCWCMCECGWLVGLWRDALVDLFFYLCIYLVV